MEIPVYVKLFEIVLKNFGSWMLEIDGFLFLHDFLLHNVE